LKCVFFPRKSTFIFSETISGCLLHIYYESDTDCEFVASLDCDPDTLSTFELSLTLRQDAGRRRSWRSKLPELVR
jgi:hypothetical protein